jgi:hypothetical protein
MKKIDFKSLVIGFVIGTMGITTVFAANSIKSAAYVSTKVKINGTAVQLSNPLVSILRTGQRDTQLYAPVAELLASLGYSVEKDTKQNTINIIPKNSSTKENTSQVSKGQVVINLKNRSSHGITESGYFEAQDNQILTLRITTNIKDGTVDLFLFAPDGKEQRITIGSSDITNEIKLSRGVWAYNCMGMFKDGGNIQILGTVNNVK